MKPLLRRPVVNGGVTIFREMTALILSLVLLGCAATKPKAIVPDTADGHDCAIDCVEAYYFCVGLSSPSTRVSVPGSQAQCKDVLKQCGLTCPRGNNLG